MPRSTSNTVWDEKTEQVLTSHLIGGAASWSREPNFPIAEIQRNADSQSRLGKADRTHVNHIAEKKSQGQVFPPIVLWQTDDNGALLVDGNNRTLADLKRKVTHVPAYVVKLSGMPEAVYLSAVFNGMAGMRLTPDELRRAVIRAGEINPPPTNTTIAADFGVSPAQIGKIRAEFSTQRNLDRLAVTGWDRLTQGLVLPLSRIQLDAPLKAAAELMIDAEMSASDARALVSEVVQLGSEREQLERINRERAERRADIEQVRAGRRSTGSPISDMRRILGSFAKVTEQFPEIDQWVSSDLEAVELWTPRIEATVNVLTAILEAHHKAIEEALVTA